MSYFYRSTTINYCCISLLHRGPRSNFGRGNKTCLPNIPSLCLYYPFRYYSPPIFRSSLLLAFFYHESSSEKNPHLYTKMANSLYINASFPDAYSVHDQQFLYLSPPTPPEICHCHCHRLLQTKRTPFHPKTSPFNIP